LSGLVLLSGGAKSSFALSVHGSLIPLEPSMRPPNYGCLYSGAGRRARFSTAPWRPCSPIDPARGSRSSPVIILMDVTTAALAIVC
jgi:hypothetical protein